MLHIVIPAYNEELRLPRTLRALRRYVTANRRHLGRVEVTVVDNASTDRTADVARALASAALPVRVVPCPVRGKGAAVRAGLLAATEGPVGPADLVCFMDADGATDLDAFAGAVAQVRGGADVVIGSRRLPTSDTEVRHCRTRSHGAACYRRLARRLLPDVADTQCGFKLMRAGLARDVAQRLVTRGFSFDVELLVRLRQTGARIVELPVSWVDVPGSTFVPLRHGARSFLDLAAIAWRTRAIAGTPLGGVEEVSPGRAASRRSRNPMPLSTSAALPALLVALIATHRVTSLDRTRGEAS
ncbi:MAG TPA: glycosyltransferase [Nocardioides sp.]|nr:glycosyltransferase [Nocardioides sp.]